MKANVYNQYGSPKWISSNRCRGITKNGSKSMLPRSPSASRFKYVNAAFAYTYGVHFGDHAEYICLPENRVIAIKPVNLTCEEAAAIPGRGQTAGRMETAGYRIPGGMKPALNGVKPL